MTMIHALHHFAFENVFQFFQIKYHAGRRIGFARHRDLQCVIVSVAIRVVALSEDSTVLLGRKIRIVIDV